MKSSLTDITQGCPDSWSAIIHVTVTGPTPDHVIARVRLSGLTWEKEAIADGGGRYHVQVNGLPYDHEIRYDGRAVNAQGRATYSPTGVVVRRACG